MTLKLDVNVLVCVGVEAKVNVVIIASFVLISSVELINVEEEEGAVVVVTDEDEIEVDADEIKWLVLESVLGAKEEESVLGAKVEEAVLETKEEEEEESVNWLSVMSDVAACVPISVKFVGFVTSIVVLTFVLVEDRKVDVIAVMVAICLVVVRTTTASLWLEAVMPKPTARPIMVKIIVTNVIVRIIFALEKLISLRTLKISETNINSLTVSENLKDLDLSFLYNFSISNQELLADIEWINLSNTKLLNISFDLFLSSSTKFVDFSFNQFSWDDFKMFKVLGNKMAALKLSQTNLQQLNQIDFRNMINLKYLDLSFNNLTFVNSTSFDIIKNLEYLDLSWNKLFDLMLF